eukprot:TRINITY_DN32219_c0_g1_i1.p1 TRINITY_DN32219_c0_g1~~TRINITY_DN32219_c0_g1_i1.p1  ORF type:complete len:508 (+),score=284.97 TRINITY_DN32219_c0_g1_i1:57-1580(+)
MPGKRGGGDPRDQFWGAVESQKMDTLRWTLSNCNGLEASTQNDEGLTSFMLAARGNKWKSMQMLIDFYARSNVLREHGWVDCQDESGMTALMYACDIGSEKCVEFLLDAQAQGRGERRGANDPTLGEKLLKQKDGNGKTALDYAKRAKKQRVIDIIQEYLAPPEEGEAQKVVGLDEEGKSKAMLAKEKKRALIEQAGGNALEKAAAQEAVHAKRIEEQEKADTTAEKIKNRKALWPEVAKVDATAEISSKICDLNVVRESAGGDCPAHGDKENPVDPALWDLAMLTRLQLKLPAGMLTTIPKEIKNLSALQTLILSGNALTTLPKEVTKLPNLKCLEVERNQLTTLPKLGKLPKLEVLKLGKNELTDLTFLKDCTQLAILQAEMNDIKSMDGIPFKNCPRLAEIVLSQNPIEEIPDEIGECPILAKLSMKETKVTELPLAITGLKKVKEIAMDGSPLADNKVKKYLAEGGKGLKELWKYIEKNAKKGGGGKKNKKKKKQVDSDEESD